MIAEYPLLKKVERFLMAHDLTPSRFGQLAIGDHKLVFQLREGRELRRATEAKVKAFMQEYRE